MMKKLDVDIKVISELNQHEHWTVGYGRHKKQKKAVLEAMKAAAIPQMLPCKITMIRIGVRKLDSDNLQAAFKWVRDAIAEHFLPGLAPGRADDSTDLHWHYHQTTGSPSTIQLEFDWTADELRSPPIENEGVATHWSQVLPETP